MSSEAEDEVERLLLAIREAIDNGLAQVTRQGEDDDRGE